MPIDLFYIHALLVHGDMIVVDYYDRSEEYASTVGNVSNTIWGNAAAVMKALYVAEACYIYYHPYNSNDNGWIFVVLDEGRPHESDMSVTVSDYCDFAKFISEKVSDGNLSLDEVVLKTVAPNNFKQWWEVASGNRGAGLDEADQDDERMLDEHNKTIG